MAGRSSWTKGKTRLEQEAERERLRARSLELYETGLTCAGVGKELDLSTSTVQNYLRPLGVDFRRAVPQYQTLPENVLTSEWVTSEAGAWVCGLVVTDGHLRTIRPDSPSPTLKITLQRRDRDGVVAAARAFGLPESVVRDHVQNDGEVSTLEFTHPKLWFLHRDLGMTLGYKITTALLPEVLVSNVHAWRGVLDGDGWGSVGPKDPHLHATLVGLSGSSFPLHAQYQTYLDTLDLPWGFYRTTKIRDGNRQPCPETHVIAEPAARLADLLYSSCEYTIIRKQAAALLVRDARLGKPGRAPRRPRVTPDEVAAMVAAFQGGEKVAHIATRMGKSAMTVADHLRRQGVLGPAARRGKRSEG